MTLNAKYDFWQINANIYIYNKCLKLDKVGIFTLWEPENTTNQSLALTALSPHPRWLIKYVPVLCDFRKKESYLELGSVQSKLDIMLVPPAQDE